jgi:hypothetical protein
MRGCGSVEVQIHHTLWNRGRDRSRAWTARGPECPNGQTPGECEHFTRRYHSRLAGMGSVASIAERKFTGMGEEEVEEEEQCAGLVECVRCVGHSQECKLP